MALAALGLLAVLAVGRGLEPDPRGYGTHTQMGLPPCGFRAATGRPCPACGLTTSVAWCVRGRFDRAAGANPAGIAVTLGCAAVAAWLAASAGLGAGRPNRWAARSAERPLVGLAVALVTLAFATWILRLIAFDP